MSITQLQITTISICNNEISTTCVSLHSISATTNPRTEECEKMRRVCFTSYNLSICCGGPSQLSFACLLQMCHRGNILANILDIPLERVKVEFLSIYSVTISQPISTRRPIRLICLHSFQVVDLPIWQVQWLHSIVTRGWAQASRPACQSDVQIVTGGSFTFFAF